MTIPPPPPPPPSPPPPPPPPDGVRPLPRRRSLPGRIVRTVVIGLISGLVGGIGLVYAYTGSISTDPPPPADICSGLDRNALGLLGPRGVVIGQYCTDIDRHLNLSLGGSDGFEGAFVQPRAPSDPASPRPVYLVWESDGCSAPVLGSGPFDFSLACNRHDFGWRNLRGIDAGDTPVWHAANKDRVDAGFLVDMRTRCAGLSGLSRLGCDTTARVYYTAVRLNSAGVRDLAGVFGG